MRSLSNTRSAAVFGSLAFGFGLLALSPAAADDAPRAGQAKAEPAPPRVHELPSNTGLVFVPRAKKGAPAARVGGGSRAGGEALEVRALVPEFDEAALTVSEQPSLYWDLSSDTEYAVAFTLIDPAAIDPLVNVVLEGPFRAGVQRVELERYAAKLVEGKRYQWFVAVMPNPQKRSADMIARGAVLRVDAPPELAAQLSGRSATEAAALLAAEGIWYDALAAASEPEALALRAALLQQVGL